MRRTLRTIRAALGATGATVALVGTGCDDSHLAADGGAGHGKDGAVSIVDAAKVVDAAMPDMLADGAVPIDALSPFPLAALASCTGPDYSADDGGMVGGYFGQCCGTAQCYAPDGGTACESAAVATQRFFFGSGECNCGNNPIRGPFAPPEDAAANGQGSCCYAVDLIGCTGRPLSTPDGHLLAPIVASTAWIA